MKQQKRELEVATKVVAIMQTITEELDESSKKMWRKIFGIPDMTTPRKDPAQKSKAEKKK